jgi:hypothetical protein
MHFYPKGNLLIVYGGKTFVDPDATVKQTEFANGVGVLRMDTLTWYRVRWRRDYHKAKGALPDLFNFSSCICEADNRLFIFGGMGASYSQSKDLYCIQLCESRISKPQEAAGALEFGGHGGEAKVAFYVPEPSEDSLAAGNSVGWGD